ncbi:MAG: hypothetical protein JO250_07415 [Armatimonadetes bacterium]|nr:hypothetical protein [Armatimonadota bacterium]
MNEVLTLDEMKARYDGEWVLVEDPELDEHIRVVRGKVIAHSADRDEMDRKAIELHLKHSASLCFKKTPEGMVYVL